MHGRPSNHISVVARLNFNGSDVNKKISVKITANFDHNLESIEQFYSDRQVPNAFDELLNDIADNVIPNLENFPEIGRNFFGKPARSVEVANALKKLQRKLNGGVLHEYLIADYAVLYARFEDIIYLLSIKHHRQLSFDFNFIWGSKRI